jgi:hypothetical protein
MLGKSRSSGNIYENIIMVLELTLILVFQFVVFFAILALAMALPFLRPILFDSKRDTTSLFYPFTLHLRGVIMAFHPAGNSLPHFFKSQNTFL